MKANIDYETKHDYKTPLDNRTRERKQLVKRVKEMKLPYYKTNYGIWYYLRIKDCNLFTSFNNN